MLPQEVLPLVMRAKPKKLRLGLMPLVAVTAQNRITPGSGF